jgi:sugar diacid utilization regulator
LRLTLSVLAYHLSDKYSDFVEVYQASGKSSLVRICYFEENCSENNTVYFILWDDLKKCKVLLEPVICIGDADEVQNFVIEKGTEALVFPDCVNLNLLYQAICDIFFKYNNYEQEIKDAIIRNDSLSTTINIVSRIFDSPVFICDAALRLLAASENSRNISDSLWMDTLNQGISSQKVMDVMQKANLIDLLNTTHRAVYIEQEPVAPFFSANFTENGKRIATITISSYEKTLDPKLLPVVDRIVELLITEVKKAGNAYYLQSTNLQKIILDMLDGFMIDERVLRRNLLAVHWNTNDEYQLIKVEMSEERVINGTAKYLEQTAHKLFPDSILVDLQDAFLLVVHWTGNQNIDNIINNAFYEFLKMQKSKAGVSMRYYNFSLSAEAYKLASIALEKGKALSHKKAIYHYGEYIIAHMIDMCTLSVNVLSLCHPEVIKLYQYDVAHDTEYLKSLYMYIAEEKHIAIAAKKLNIHRNTLVYRLGKLSEFCTLDLDDSASRLHLIWSYQVLQYLKPEF